MPVPNQGSAETALDLLLERFPTVRMVSGNTALRIRRYEYPPVLVVDGQRSLGRAIEGLDRIPVADVVDLEVEAAMGETMVYGADAALGGVIKVTTRLGLRRQG